MRAITACGGILNTSGTTGANIIQVGVFWAVSHSAPDSFTGHLTPMILRTYPTQTDRNEIPRPQALLMSRGACRDCMHDMNEIKAAALSRLLKQVADLCRLIFASGSGRTPPASLSSCIRVCGGTTEDTKQS